EKAIGVEPNPAFQKLAASFSDPLVLLRETPGQRTLVIAFDTSTTDLPLRVAFPILIANAIRYLHGEETTERWVNPRIGTLLTRAEVGKLTAGLEGGSNAVFRAI